MVPNGNVCKLLSVVLTILVCKGAAHEGNHHGQSQHPHQFQIPQLPLLTNAPGQKPHSHGQGSRPTHEHGSATHEHRPVSGHLNQPATHTHGSVPSGHSHGTATHTHPSSLIPQRTRFVISNLWNGSPDTASQASDKGGNQVLVTLEDNPKLNSVVMYIDAPFYDDPSPPNGVPGEAYFKLWEYEVVEAFFLSKDSEKYIELEFGPHGQHQVLLLDGRRNTIKHSLPLNYRSQINRQTKRWYGKAIIPLSYFPPQVDRMNSYAIHDQDVSPIYKSLYPSNGAQPDFHDLASFAEFNALPTLKNVNQLSSTWEEALRNPLKKED